MEQALPQIRKHVEIDLAEYGKTGKIVLSKPDFGRGLAVENTTMSVVLTSEEIKKIRTLSPEARDNLINERVAENIIVMQLVSILGHIEEAPFHLNNYRRVFKLDFESFIEFMEGCDKYQELYDRLVSEVNSIDSDSPLPEQTDTVQSV